MEFCHNRNSGDNRPISVFHHVNKSFFIDQFKWFFIFIVFSKAKKCPLKGNFIKASKIFKKSSKFASFQRALFCFQKHNSLSLMRDFFALLKEEKVPYKRWQVKFHFQRADKCPLKGGKSTQKNSDSKIISSYIECLQNNVLEWLKPFSYNSLNHTSFNFYRCLGP